LPGLTGQSSNPGNQLLVKIGVCSVPACAGVMWTF
jgi:hypothetical protein